VDRVASIGETQGLVGGGGLVDQDSTAVAAKNNSSQVWGGLQGILKPQAQ